MCGASTLGQRYWFWALLVWMCELPKDTHNKTHNARRTTHGFRDVPARCSFACVEGAARRSKIATICAAVLTCSETRRRCRWRVTTLPPRHAVADIDEAGRTFPSFPTLTLPRRPCSAIHSLRRAESGEQSAETGRSERIAKRDEKRRKRESGLGEGDHSNRRPIHGGRRATRDIRLAMRLRVLRGMLQSHANARGATGKTAEPPPPGQPLPWFQAVGLRRCPPLLLTSVRKPQFHGTR